LLGSQNTTRRLPSTFPQTVFSSNAGFTLSCLSINYMAFMSPLGTRGTSVRPDKDRHVQLTISGKQERKEGRIEEKNKWKKERSKEGRKMARKIKDRLSNGRYNFFRQHSPLHLHNPSVVNFFFRIYKVPCQIYRYICDLLKLLKIACFAVLISCHGVNKIYCAVVMFSFPFQSGIRLQRFKIFKGRIIVIC